MSCSLRPVGRAQRARLEALTRATGLFREDEVATAVDFLGAYDGVTLVGWACWGPTSGTRATYDLYWIAVDPERQGQRVGTQLLGAVEQELKADGCRLIVVETSSRAVYEPTRRFYERRGYTRAATLPGYYAPGDDLVIYLKDLADGDLAGTTA